MGENDRHSQRRLEDALRASEERYRAFVANSSEAIWRVELERPVPVALPEDEQVELFYRHGVLAECNDAMARMYGYERAEEIAGARLGDLLIRSDPANVDYLRAFIRSGYRLTDAETVEADKEGSLRHFLNSLVGVVERGRLLRAWGTQRDISKRKQAEETLRKQASLIDLSPVAVVVRDAEGRITLWSKGAEALYGWRAEEALGRRAHEILGTSAERPLEEIETEFRRAGWWEGELLHARRDGERIVVQSRWLQRGAGDAGEVLVTNTDVTERKAAEAERERLLASERRARAEAEAALGLHRSVEERLSDLAEASGVLLGSLRIEAVQPAILDLSRRLVSADAYAIWRRQRSADGVRWHIASSAGVSERYIEQSIRDAGETDYLLEQPVIAEDVLHATALEHRREMYRAEGIASLLVVPLRIHAEASGTLAFYYRRRHRFVDTEVRVATALANFAGAALTSAELYEDQRRMSAAAAEAGRRSKLLAEASAVIGSSLDYEAALSRVAGLMVPGLADWCAVDMLGDDGSILGLAVAHVDPEKVEWARELQRRYPPDPAEPRGVPNVLRTGVSELYPEIPDELLATAARDDEHLSLMRAAGFTSAMLVPLSARGRTLGVIAFVSGESGRRYGPADLAFAEDLARRAAVAVDNARLFREAQEARAKAEEANRLKDEFLATMSHELRTPLNAILGWTRLLLAGKIDGPGAQRALETIDRNAKAQVQIVDDVLDISRIITGRLRLDVRLVDLGGVIEAAVDAVRPAADAKGVKLQVLLDSHVAPVSGDPDRLQQVVWNLLSNAVKFTPRGGRVQARLERVNSHAEIVVSDTGAGIEPEFLPYVFDRFRQADSSTTRRHGGLGLGLAIVRQLVEMHGGSVSVESPGAGGGATFTAQLPLAPVQEAPLPERSPEARERPEAGEPAAFDCPPSLESLRVLVVDDEEDARAVLTTVLAACRAEVMAVGTAAEALAAVERFHPDVLLSDIGMPGEDGYELIRKVRALPRERGGRTPAVALTAYARTEDRLRALAAGYQMHVPKPVEPTELLTVVATLAAWGRG
jgi:PAS domain S-box-containing protein